MRTTLTSLLRAFGLHTIAPDRVARRRLGSRLAVERMEERRLMTTTAPVPPPETDYFLVTGIPATATAGVPFSVTVTEYSHATGKQVTVGAVNTATITAESGGIASPLGSISLVGGSGKGTVTPTKSQTMLVVATNGSTANLKTYVTGTSTSSVVVSPGAVSQFVVTVPTNAQTLFAFAITVTAEDRYGNINPTYSANPTVVANDGQSVKVVTNSWSAGVDKMMLAVYEPDNLTLTVSPTGNAFRFVTSTISVITGPASPGPTWSGYSALPGANVTAVGGTWVEPTVTGPGQSAIWVGIDGDVPGGAGAGGTGGTVEQLGVGTTQVNGVTVYTPWIEFYGDQQGSKKGPDYYEVPLPSSYVVHPGDTISASVTLVGGTNNEFDFQMKDAPRSGPGWTYTSLQTMKYVVPARSTVEWIVENPNDAVQPLANFGTVTFTGAWATVAGVTGSLNAQTTLNPLNISNNEGHDITSSPPNIVKSLGYNEPTNGVYSGTFSVTWTSGASGAAKTQPASLLITNGDDAMDGLFSEFGPRAGAMMPSATVLDRLFAGGERGSSFFDLV